MSGKPTVQPALSPGHPGTALFGNLAVPLAPGGSQCHDKAVHRSNLLAPSPLLIVVFLLVAAAALPLPALTLKIGTLAPEGSPWVDSLRRLAAEWERLSGGSVKLKIYPGGIVGEEPDMVRKLRIGQLHGAALTQLGLGLLEPGILAISVPFLIQEDRELDYVLDRSRPYFGELLEQKGYRLVALSKGGWVHFFARQPIVYPAELRRLKLAVPAGDSDFVDSWQRMGFNAFSLPISDLLLGLQTGMADAFYAPLLAAASFQWFGAARYMPSVSVAPVIGGILIGSRYLERIPEQIRPALLEGFRRLERSLNDRMVALEAEALVAMKKHGLIIVPVAKAALNQWKQLGAGGAQMVIGRSFPVESYEQILGYLTEYRAGAR